MEGVTQHSDVTHSGFYTDHLFYFFVFITPSVFCIIFLIYVSMSIKYLKTDQVPEFLQRSHSFLCQKMELSSAFLRNTFHYYCRIPLSISAEYISVFFAKHLLIFLRGTSQPFFKTALDIFAEQLPIFFARFLSIFLQKNSQYFFRTDQYFCRVPFIILAEYISIFLQIDFQYFLQDSFQYFCRKTLNISSEQINIFADPLSIFSQNTFQYSTFNIFAKNLSIF